MLEQVFDTLFPPQCAGCRVPGRALCADCAASVGPPVCFSLGALRCVALGPYDGALRLAILRMKSGRRGAIEPLGALLGSAALATFGTSLRAVPIPTTDARRRERGFDQSCLLARVAARHFGLPSLGVLRRTAGEAQHGHSRAQRLAASGRFAVRAKEGSLLQGARVVLVDDVATTGATLRDAAQTLARAGADVRGAAVIARADDRQMGTMTKALW